jgi:hypothetical protein
MLEKIGQQMLQTSVRRIEHDFITRTVWLARQSVHSGALDA